MYGNNTSMYANMMGQQAGGMVGQQMGVAQMGTQLGGQMAGQSGQPMSQMQSQLVGQMPQLLTQAGQQQGALQQPTPGTGMMTGLHGMTGMAGMSGMSGMNMSGMTGMNPAGGATATPANAAPGLMGQQGTGMMGQQGTGMVGQQGTGMMGQQGMNSGMSNWQTMAAGNPQAMAAMQAYMQQYAMRMAAYQRMAAAASAGGMSNPGGMGAMGSMGPMGAMGGMAGPMGAMGGMAGPMGAMGGMAPGGMGLMGAQMQQQHHMRSSQQQAGQDGGENTRFWKTRICNKWKEGHCPYGPTCKYAHGDADLRSPLPEGGKGGARAPKAEVDKRTMIELMKKTRICEEFVRTGSCKYGDKCTFAHGHNELRLAPSTLTTQQQQQQGSKEGSKEGSLHKTRLCERFMNTKSCPYGDKCTFAHGHHELRSKGAVGTAAAGNRTQVQQKPRKPLQKGEGSGGAPVPIAGSKREREEPGSGGAAGEGGEAGDNSTEAVEPAKRQHVGAAEAFEGGERQQQGEEAPSQQQERAGDGEDRWNWGSSPSPNRDGGDAGDEIEMVEQPQRRGGDQQDDDEEGGRTAEEDADERPGCDTEIGSPNGAMEAAGADGAAGGAGDVAVGHVSDHAAAGPAGTSEPECRLCAAMVKMGRDKMVAAVQQLDSTAAQKLGAMVLAYGTPRFEQLWHKLSFGQLQTMLSKSELSVADRIELLKAVSFHTHASEEDREKLESQKYVSQGLPPVVADFVAMVLDGKEGSTQMAEYFAALEVCKTLYGVTEDEYFNVSSTMASLFMNM